MIITTNTALVFKHIFYWNSIMLVIFVIAVVVDKEAAYGDLSGNISRIKTLTET